MPAFPDACQEFHTFRPKREPTVIGSLQPFVPRKTSHLVDNDQYWTHHIGLDWPDAVTPADQMFFWDRSRPEKARSIRVDARIPGLARANDVRSYIRWEFPKWLAAGALMYRVSAVNPHLRALHVRMSANADMYDMLQKIIAQSSHLVDVIIEDDTHPGLDGLQRPVLDLGRLLPTNFVGFPSQFERFLVRAPAVQVITFEADSFALRLASVKTLGFAVHDFSSGLPTWQLALCFLRYAPKVERVELATSNAHEARAPEPLVEEDIVHVPRLKHLVLDLQEVDARLLGRLDAPSLKHLQIRSLRDIGSFGLVEDNHFPGLFCVTLYCPGPVVERFLALGLQQQQFLHNFTKAKLFERDCDEPLLAYVAPRSLANALAPVRLHNRPRCSSLPLFLHSTKNGAV